MQKHAMKMIFSIGLGILAILPAAKADTWNQRTVLTFSESVEVPGQTLPAGSYVFKLANSNTYRHIVQVFNKDENRVLATFLAIPSHRDRPADKTIIRFDERAAGSPQAIKAWFYPAKNYGHEFVYPKQEAAELAKANDMPVPAISSEFMLHTTAAFLDLRAPEIQQLSSAPLKAERPNGEEVELAQAFPQVAQQEPELPNELPATASWMPLIGLVGLFSLGTGLVLRFRTVRVR